MSASDIANHLSAALIAFASLSSFDMQAAAPAKDESPVGRGWPLVTMRQMTCTSFDAKTCDEMIAIHAKYPAACGEWWLAEGSAPTVTAQVARAGTLGVVSGKLRAAGIIPGFQQGKTLGHVAIIGGGMADGGSPLPEDAYQIDVDGNRTAFLCPTSPEVLAAEEAFAEIYVREAKVESFWLDDDLRLGFHKGRAAGCWCGRCLGKLNEKAGTQLTREEFIARLNAPTNGEPLRAVWADFKAESLAGYAAAARRGAKKANPAVRMGYQSVTSDEISSGRDYRPLLAALSDDFRDAVGIRAGSGFYKESDARSDLMMKLLGVAREAERCRAIPGWKGSVVYEQENYPHYAMEKSAEFCVKECALALAAGCDAVAEYWYSSAIPEPLGHYEDMVRITAAWRPYFARLAEISARTHLGGIARRSDPALMTSRANSVEAILGNAMQRFDACDVRLAFLGVPVTVAEAGTKSFYNPADIPAGMMKTAERAELLDGFDRLPGGPLPVRTDKVHPLLLFARVDDAGKTVAVTFFNFSLGTAIGVPVRVRRPAGRAAALLRPAAADSPLEIRSGAGDEILFTLPDLPPAGMCTVVFDGVAGGVRLVDLSSATNALSYVRRSENGVYWGHPTTALLEDGRTMYCVYPFGHGGRGGQLALSEDGGRTWKDVSERLPAVARRHTNCPCLHLLKDRRGRSRLIYWSSFLASDEKTAVSAWTKKETSSDDSTAMPACLSEDGGKTWRALPPLGSKFRNVLPFQGIVALGGAPGRYLGVFHRGPDGCFDNGPLEVLAAVTEDGGETWSDPCVIAKGPDWDLCEPWVFRSPDGRELCCLIRENRRTPAKVIYSRDEGKTWTKPVDAPSFLDGHRHQGVRLRDGRYAIGQRMVDKTSPFYGHYTIWFGTYDELKSGAGGVLVRPLRNYGRLWDCGYSSVHQLPDGDLVATTYNVCAENEKCSVVTLRLGVPEAGKGGK